MSYGYSLACSRRSFFSSKLPLLVLASLLALRSSAAQSSAGSDQAVLIQKLMDRIDQLEKRVSELENEKGVSAGASSFTARADAGLGSPPAGGFNMEVERSIIRFEKNDHLKISFGRYHTPINYWNTAFHHGAWLQTTINRPEMVQFGGSLLPVHFVGALAEGSFPLRGLNLHYASGVGNGRGAVITRDGDFGDVNNSRAWLVNLFAVPDHPYGLEVGGSVYRDKVNPAAGQ